LHEYPVRSEELKAAKTESQFRDVNERIAESAERVGADEVALVCECHDPECGTQIDVTVEDYEDTRADGARFLVAPGHERPDLERVLRTRPGYRVVEKQKAVGDVARRLSPRPTE
jgi:hypothetical protein